MTESDMSEAAWITSRACNNSACVQVAHLPGGLVALRDFKDMESPPIFSTARSGRRHWRVSRMASSSFRKAESHDDAGDPPYIGKRPPGSAGSLGAATMINQASRSLESSTRRLGSVRKKAETISTQSRQ